MPENVPTKSVLTNMQEPPDISVLEDRSRLDYYITILKRWSGEVIKKIIDWFNNKSSMNKHVDMVKVLNLFLNTTRSKSENFVE